MIVSTGKKKKPLKRPLANFSWNGSLDWWPRRKSALTLRLISNTTVSARRRHSPMSSVVDVLSFSQSVSHYLFTFTICPARGADWVRTLLYFSFCFAALIDFISISAQSSFERKRSVSCGHSIISAYRSNVSVDNGFRKGHWTTGRGAN